MSDAIFKGLPDAGSQSQESQSGEGQETETDQNLPEELRGKSPGEIYETLKQEHERIMQEEQQRLQQSQQTAQSQGQGQQGQQQYTPPYNPYSGGQTQSNDSSSDDDDYEPFPGVKSFMDKQFSKRLNPLVQTTFTSLREQNKNALIQKIGQEKWQKYGSEIEQIVGGMSPQVQVDPRAYDQAYKFVQANHIDDIAAERAEQIAQERLARQQDEDYEPEEEAPKPAQKQRGSLFQNNTGTPHVAKPASGASARNQNTGKSRKLTAEEKAVCKKFGMSEKEYIEWSEENG